MELTFKDAAKERIEKRLNEDTKIVLDFDDGVGPFSDAASCTLDVAFSLVLCRPDQLTADYDQHLSSNLGDVYFKGYADTQLDGRMIIDVDKMLRYKLSGDSGIIDPNMMLRDVQAN